MKYLLLTISAFFVTQWVAAQPSFYKDVVALSIDYQPTTMKKFQYRTDADYIVEESYTNYHIPVDDEYTIILKVQQSTEGVRGVKTQKMTVNDIARVDRDFVHRVNGNATPLYLNKGGVYYQVSYVLLRHFTPKRMAYYAPPHLSFYFNYDERYYPGENVYIEGSDEIDYAVRHFFHGTTETHGIRNDVLLKMYRDACYNRDYGVTTPLSPVGNANPQLKVVSPKTGKPLYRSCQHPIQSEYLYGIGLYKEFYMEEDRVFKSELVSINDIPVADYLAGTRTVNEEALIFAQLDDEMNDSSSPLASNDDAPSGARTLDDLMADGNMPRGVTVPSAAKKYEVVAERNSLPVVGGKVTQQHKVKTGDTLYSISKRYKVSIDTLKSLNKLEDNTIYIGQDLIIKL